MATTTIVYRGSKESLLRSLRMLPAILSGAQADPLQLADGLRKRMGVAVLSKVTQNFLVLSRGGVGVGGVKWVPLAKRTLTKKRTSGSATVDVLRDTGRLLRSLAAGVEDRPSGAPGQEFRLEPGAVIVGTNVPYGLFHQEGRPPHLPARPFLPTGQLPPEWEADIEEAAATGLIRAVELMAAAGGVV